MKQWKQSLLTSLFGLFCAGFMVFGFTGPEHIKIGLICANVFLAGLNFQCAIMWYREEEQWLMNIQQCKY
ncbi:MAG: hypothetical protein PHX21_13815 [bacterium]|nr:hypothetical protein [bacterium]